MSPESTRRDFLKMSAAGLAATATLTQQSTAESGTASTPPSGKVEVWVTNQKTHCTRAADTSWKGRAAAPAGPVIALDPKQQFQTVLGFGAAFTDASCYMFNQLSSTARAQLFREMFHPSEMGLNVCRICMGASDYSTSVYSYDEGEPDPQLERFSIAHDRDYILPMLREARSVNPELFLFSSPWSPPGWMKAGGSMLGGSMRRRYIPNYAQYFIKFLQAYAAEGVVVQAVTPQNEVDTDQDGKMPACVWPQEYEIEFVQKLGPLLEQNQLTTKIWILDHNYNLWGRAVCELDNPQVRQYSNAVAWHGYVGTAEMMTKFHEFHPDAAMHWTEGGPDYTSPDYLTDWAKWAKVFTDVLRNGCQSITGWNLALDEQGRPNLGPFPCGGVVTINSQSKEITRSGQYWAFAQFSRFIRRGARRFASQSTALDVAHLAVEHPDGRRVLVLTNPAAAQTASMQMGEKQADISLDGNSVTTLVWS
jgi:glucosylceramidase